MSRIFLFALIFSLSACKLEPIEKTNELELGSTTGGDLGEPDRALPTTSAWFTGNFSLYSIETEEQLVNGRFSVIVNGARVNHIGDFVFTEAEDFNYFIQNKELFEVANTVPLTIKVKLLRKGSSCSPVNEQICLTVITPDVFQIEDIQAIE